MVSADQADGVNILSQSYSISVSWQYQWYQELGAGPLTVYSSDNGTNSASANDGTPGNVGFVTPSPPGLGTPNFLGQPLASGLYASSGISTFTFQSTGYALPGFWSMTGSDGYDYYLSGHVDLSAQANWLFQPTSENQQITLNLSQGDTYFSDQNLAVTLTDVTDLNTLLAYSYGFGVQNGTVRSAAQTYVFSLNPGDQYQLSVSGQSDTSDTDILNQQFSASIEPAPEPSACCLFPLALASFIASRKQIRVK
jgi:hypothetical protein